MIKAMKSASDGAPDQARGGETPSPSQAYFFGILAEGWKAALVNSNMRFSYGWMRSVSPRSSP
jgi:hypothetical protein